LYLELGTGYKAVRSLMFADFSQVVEAFDDSAEDDELLVEGRHGGEGDVELGFVAVRRLAAR
jgi:hypothetical protein